MGKDLEERDRNKRTANDRKREWLDSHPATPTRRDRWTPIGLPSYKRDPWIAISQRSKRRDVKNDRPSTVKRNCWIPISKISWKLHRYKRSTNGRKIKKIVLFRSDNDRKEGIVKTDRPTIVNKESLKPIGQRSLKDMVGFRSANERKKRAVKTDRPTIVKEDRWILIGQRSSKRDGKKNDWPPIVKNDRWIPIGQRSWKKDR